MEMSKGQKLLINVMRALQKHDAQNNSIRKELLEKRIYLGRLESLGKKFEISFAKELKKVISHSKTVLVDCPITLEKSSGERAITLYPDIAIIENNELKAIIELKLDGGWLGKALELENIKKIKKNNKRLLNSKEITYKEKKEHDEKRIEEKGKPKDSKNKIAVSPEFFGVAIVWMKDRNNHRRCTEEYLNFMRRELNYRTLGVIDGNKEEHDIRCSSYKKVEKEFRKQVAKPSKKREIDKAFNGLIQ